VTTVTLITIGVIALLVKRWLRAVEQVVAINSLPTDCSHLLFFISDKSVRNEKTKRSEVFYSRAEELTKV